MDPRPQPLRTEITRSEFFVRFGIHPPDDAEATAVCCGTIVMEIFYFIEEGDEIEFLENLYKLDKPSL